MKRPTVVAFDVFETMFSLESLKPRLARAGLPAQAVEVLFLQILRDAMALEITGSYEPFRDVAGSALKELLAANGARPEKGKVDDVLDGFAQLAPQPDLAPALKALHEADVRMVTLSNGAAKNTKAILKDAGLYDYIEEVISIDDVGHWKPARAVYEYAADEVGVKPGAMMLVAAHGWDIHGAGRAGLRTAFVSRGKPFPAMMKAPDLEGMTLEDVSRKIIEL